MLLTLNQKIQDFTPTDFISSRLTDDGVTVEYYRALREPEGETGAPSRCILIACSDNGVIEREADYFRQLELAPEYDRWQDVGIIRSVGSDMGLLAFEIPDDTVSLGEIIKAERLSLETVLPLFHDILSSYFATYGAEMFDKSLHPSDILISTDTSTSPARRKTIAIGAPPARHLGMVIDRRGLLYTAPELTDGGIEADEGRAWVFQAGLLLTVMLQNRLPWRFAPIAPDTTPQEFAEMRRQGMQPGPRLEVIGGLRRLLVKAINADPVRRYASPQEFITEVERYARIYGARDLRPLILSTSAPDDAVGEAAPSDSDRTEPDTSATDAGVSDDDTPIHHRRSDSHEPQLRMAFRRGKGQGFKDVAGLDDIKAKMTRNFISIVKNPDIAKAYRIEPPNGVLLWGPPGNGKSFLSQKLAEESGLLYTIVNPGDLSSIYVHGTQGLISEMFNKCERMAAQKKSGVLLVLEEFDALVPNRMGGDNNSRSDEVAEFLTRLNNCASKGVYVIATTNRIDAIDPAVMRKGRMDEIIYMDLPDEDVRRSLLDLELRDRPHDEIDLNRLVKLTAGFSSGDISYLVKESARKAFEQTISDPGKSMSKISQATLEDTIAHAHPSVTEAERRKYEKLRDSYSRDRRDMPKVGF